MRIKINTKNIAKKLSSVSCKMSAFKKPSVKSYQLKAILSAFRNLRPKTYHLKPSRGFTLIELLVVISLFVALTTIALFSQQKFNGSILLTNLAYDVALTIRQAQSFGVNVREAPGGIPSEVFDHAYGVHFNKSSSGDSTHFILFADINDTRKYDGNWDCKSSSNSCIDRYSIKRGNYISAICVNNSCDSVDRLNITFKRPNPDAIIKGDSYPDATEAKITISSADGVNTRDVIVNSTGQISVSR